MLAFWVVEQLDVFKNTVSRFFAGAVLSPPDLLPLQELKETLGHCIVMAVAPTAHRVFQIVFEQERRPITAGELRALI